MSERNFDVEKSFLTRLEAMTTTPSLKRVIKRQRIEIFLKEIENPYLLKHNGEIRWHSLDTRPPRV